MARRLLLACTSLAFASATGSAQQPACDVFCHSQLAERAAAAGDFAGYAAHVREVAARAPSHPGVVYAQARAFARSGAPDSAIAALARLGRMGDTRDPNADSVFAPLRARPGYASARNRLLSNRLPILDGKVAFEIADPDFVPEALAFDSTRGRFLVGSLARRVVSAVAPNGAVTPYIAHAPNMLRVVGIHIDAARGRLWFATWAPDSTHRDSTEPPSITRLFLAELATGRIIKSWTPDGGRPGHLLNDFVVMRDGSLYLTDTEKGSIYRLRSPDDTLELFVQPPLDRYTSANGITVHPDERALYVAFLEGIARLDLTTRESHACAVARLGEHRVRRWVVLVRRRPHRRPGNPDARARRQVRCVCRREPDHVGRGDRTRATGRAAADDGSPRRNSLLLHCEQPVRAPRRS